MFENKMFNGIHYSRFVASWNHYGDGYNPIRFEQWLKSMELPEDVINEIRFMYENGKMELERHARMFCKTHEKGMES